MNTSRAFGGRFVLYSSRNGDPACRQMRDLLAAGLGRLGVDVRIRDQEEGLVRTADWHLMVAPHEFDAPTPGESANGNGLPDNLILLNTERPAGPGFSRAGAWFSRARFIWDIDLESSLTLRSMGHDCSYLPLGFLDGFPLFVPEAGARDEDVRSEVLFLGEPSPRRDAFFSRHAERLARCLRVIPPSPDRARPGTRTAETLVGLARQSRILLHVHHGADPAFDWHSNVLLGIAQKRLLVTEPGTLAPPFRANLDFIEAPLEEIPERIEYHLASPSGLREAAEIAERGHRTLMEQCRLTEVLAPLLGRLVDVTGPDWLGTWSFRAPAASDARARLAKEVCVVVPDLSGEGSEREQGAAQTALAQSLARMGHDVTVLHARSREDGRRPMGDWYLNFAAQGIRYVALPETASTRNTPMEAPTLSYAIWLWLGMQTFDLVHFPDSQGIAFQSVLGKRRGLGLDQTLLCVNVQGPGEWRRSICRDPAESEFDFEVDVMEKESIRLADAVVVATSDLRDWMTGEGWALPQQTTLLPTLTTDTDAGGSRAVEAVEAVREIVFAGPLDQAGGLGLFCDALDRLTAEDLRFVSVTFVGRPGEAMEGGSEHYVWNRSDRWACPWRVLSGIGTEEAWNCLERPGQLPVFAGHFPQAIRRCMARGIPFLSLDTGGLGETIAVESRDRTLFKPTAGALARAIRDAVAHGVRRVTPVMTEAEMELRWCRWHDDLLARPAVPASPLKLHLLPRENVVVAGYDLTGRFGQAVAG